MSNRLASETSPYLLQHAGNPVDWHAWGDEALALARAQDRPILLSIGYSACHWCHVMAHECFENAETAALMNRHFVNIKVDREERPDLDQIYQTAHQLITGRAGGWPLTMFLTPDGKPFFGGTYFPKRARGAMPGFDDLLQRIAELWRDRRDALDSQAADVVRLLGETLPGASADGEALDAVAAGAGRGLRDALMRIFDAVEGGFGRAPKFPQTPSVSALLRHAVAEGDRAARDAALLTLRRMAEGGLFDQLGGGFFRYSTDDRWSIPHFEKMLYDNGPLLRLYAEAWQASRDPLFERACRETAEWLIRDMQSADGGYFSSIDADSEGEEGRFYVWQPAEVRALLGDADYEIFAAIHGLDGPPNFEGRAWHLRVARPVSEVAAERGIDEAACAAIVAAGRRRLCEHRAKRVAPGVDDKILTSWNALAIDGMAFAARVFDEPGWRQSARRALDFIRRALWKDGRLLATHRGGRSQLNAYLDDYAFLLGALLEAMQGDTVRPADIEWTIAIADALLDRFADGAGGFHFTSHDHESLVMRPKSGYDPSTPSGNGFAALPLQRLGHLLGEPRYLDAARQALALFAADIGRSPHGHATLIAALAEYRSPAAQAILTGPVEVTADWIARLAARYAPGAGVWRLPDDPRGLPHALVRPVAADEVQAWVCRGNRCLAPITDFESLQRELATVGN